MEPTPRVVKDGAQHTDITVNRTRSETTRTAAVEKPRKAEMNATEGVNLSAPTLIAEVQKPQDVERRGSRQRRGRDSLRRTDGTKGQKRLEVQTKTLLRFPILRVTNVRTKLGTPPVKCVALQRGKARAQNGYRTAQAT